MSALPTHGIFLACDDIREEPNGKVSLMGVLGHDFTVPPPPPGSAIALNSFCIFVSFQDGEGTFTTRLRLQDPDGTDVLPQNQTGNAAKQLNGSMNFILRFAPFHVKFGGPYRLTVSLDNKSYEWQFNIRKAPKPS